MAYTNLKAEIRDRVGLITLNRPSAMNALNAEMLHELAEAIGKYDGDDAVASIVLTGDEKVFCAGRDIAELRAATPVALMKKDQQAADWAQIWRARKPLIGAVAGYANGGGFELALACDFVIAAQSARFGFPEATLGVIPSAGGVQRLTRLVGRAKAMEMLLTGRNMDANEAERSGLVSRVAPADDLVDEALRAAATIAERAPLAVLAAKDAVRAVDETHLTEGVRAEHRLLLALLATEDASEGMDAFIEQRAPQFRGK
ncbi:MAG: enoyl-CoA hydratase-related protein [Neomegalonema sp.]|nr:enoyl-CoA hydratase-related protein [Neomegalonema sp.]